MRPEGVGVLGRKGRAWVWWGVGSTPAEEVVVVQVVEDAGAKGASSKSGKGKDDLDKEVQRKVEGMFRSFKQVKYYSGELSMDE